MIRGFPGGTSTLVAITLAVVALGAPSTANAQIAPPSGTGPSLGHLAFPDVHASLDPSGPGSWLAAHPLATPPPAVPLPVISVISPALASPTLERESFPWVTIGLRGGVFAVTDKDSDEVYGAMLMYGADLKVHIWKLPLAVQLGYDLAKGEGSTDDYAGMDGVDATGRVIFWNYRVSLILEPPPGLFGPKSGGFYVTPYVGGGIGQHTIEIDLEGNTQLGPFDKEVRDQRIGYHALLGIDFVFAKLFSVGLEFMWTTVEVEDPLDSDETLEYGGLSLGLTVRFHI